MESNKTSFKQSLLVWWLSTSRPDKYEVLSKGIVLQKRGTLSINDFDSMLRFSEITRVEYSRGIMGWIFGYGHIVIWKRDGSSIALELVNDARTLAQIIDAKKAGNDRQYTTTKQAPQ